MNLMAFLLHTVLDMTDTRYRTVHNALPSRRTFFEHLRPLTHYLPFDSWHHLCTAASLHRRSRPNDQLAFRPPQIELWDIAIFEFRIAGKMPPISSHL